MIVQILLQIEEDFYSSLESFLEENFENTDFSIKKIETIKPEIGIQTFKIFSEDFNSKDLYFYTIVTEKHLI